jgi:hypothetical protein
MLFVLTYDVDRDHYAVKQACLRVGFVDCIRTDDGSRLRLPNTTLLGDFASADESHTCVAPRVVSPGTRATGTCFGRTVRTGTCLASVSNGVVRNALCLD